MPAREILRLNRFKRRVWGYYKAYKRDFPWRRTRDPYQVLVSEIMLQQTQTDRVEPKFNEFLKRFPDFNSLAKAPLADVLRAWQGLGYNRRALALKKCAEIVVARYQGKLPKDTDLLDALPGIGPGTAGAIRAFAFNLPSIFIETNIRRVFIYFFFPQRRKVRDEEIFKLIRKTADQKNSREWYWALMDYGAMLGRTEKQNPNTKSKHYKKQSRFKGSNRELRGRILRLRLAKPHMRPGQIAEKVGHPIDRVSSVLNALKKEGLA